VSLRTASYARKLNAAPATHMCGRYALIASAPRLARLLGLVNPLDLSARYNIAPSQAVPVVRSPEPGQRALAMVRWGLIPGWAKAPKSDYRMINAKAETLAQRPAFRVAFRRRRCLIPADGFYEWKRLEGGKQPYFITMEDREPFAFAGLWERWEGADGETIDSCAIIATPANDTTLMVRPVINKPRNAATAQIGIAIAPITVPEAERRNRNNTNTANPAPIARFCVFATAVHADHGSSGQTLVRASQTYSTVPPQVGVTAVPVRSPASVNSSQAISSSPAIVPGSIVESKTSFVISPGA